MWFASISDLRAGLEVRPWGRKDFQSTYIMIVVRLILPDHHHYHIDHHLYHTRGGFAKASFGGRGCLLCGWTGGREARSSHVLWSSSYLLKLCSLIWSSSYLHWSGQTRSSHVLWSSSYLLKLCSLIILLFSLRQTLSDQRTMMAFWSVKGGIIIISSLEKHRVWSNHHDGIFIKADKVKLCSLIIIISSIEQRPSDQLVMMVFWSVEGGKVKLHPLIVVLSSWEND